MPFEFQLGFDWVHELPAELLLDLVLAVAFASSGKLEGKGLKVLTAQHEPALHDLIQSSTEKTQEH